jgi:hypothetical protein
LPAGQVVRAAVLKLERAVSVPGGPKQKPPALVDRLVDEALVGLQPLHRVGSWLALALAGAVRDSIYI